MTSFVMTEVYEKLLLGVYQFHLITAEQLCRLYYSPGSLTTIKARLKTLADNGYVLADKIPSKKPNSPYYYTLATGGISYLKKEGHAIPPSMRASKEQDKQPTHIQHTIELNDVVIAATLLGQQSDIYWLESFIHERELKQPRYKYDVVPDAFLEFRMRLETGRQRRLAVLLEHDCATEHINAFKPRIRGYIKMLKSEAHRDLYGVGIVTIAFTTYKGGSHLDKLVRWTKEELTESRCLQAYGGAFYFANLAPAPDPKTLWLEPVWKTPLSNEPLSLLAG